MPTPAYRGPRAPRGRWMPIAVLGASLWSNPSAAIEQFQAQLGNLSGKDWRAHQVTLTLQLDGAADVTASRLVLPAPLGELRDVRLHCRRLDWSARQVRCAQGQLRAGASPLGSGPMPVSFAYRPDPGSLWLQLRDARFAAGRVNLQAQQQHGRWRMQIEGRQLHAAALAAELPGLALPDGLQLAGSLDLEATAQLSAQGLQDIEIQAHTSDGGFVSADGVHAAERLALQARLTATPESGGWRLQGQLTAAQGTVCAGSCWDLPSQPLTLEASARWREAERHLTLESFQLRDTGTLQASGSGRYAVGAETPWQALDVRLRSDDASRLYARYLQPLLIGTVLEQLDVSGALQARIRRAAEGSWSVDAELRQLSFEDRQQRFGVRGLQGTLAWHDGPGTRRSELSWEAGNLYQIPVGPSRVQLETERDGLRLAAPASIPVFDGSLELARLALQQPGTDAMRWNVDAVLTPVAMEDFSRAMGWPVMAGRLSGVIPELRYAERRLTADGVLLIRVFDGEATIRDLRVEDLLGVVPTLNADLRLRNIDLRQLTGTFSFGRIEGRLDGSVLGLELQNWRPVAFDAQFATPENDRSRHRISQRAVDNLTSLGGGIGGALSRSFLRVFDDFSYARLGLKCRLQAGVCEMGGVAPAPQGYYIVKGGGLPRIDVIGYQRRVDWEVLIKRLAAVTSGGGPVIR